MGLVFRKRKQVAPDTYVNVSAHGISLSQRLSDRVTVSSRGRVSVRLLPGFSWRFKV